MTVIQKVKAYSSLFERCKYVSNYTSFSNVLPLIIAFQHSVLLYLRLQRDYLVSQILTLFNTLGSEFQKDSVQTPETYLSLKHIHICSVLSAQFCISLCKQVWSLCHRTIKVILKIKTHIEANPLKLSNYMFIRFTNNTICNTSYEYFFSQGKNKQSRY